MKRNTRLSDEPVKWDDNKSWWMDLLKSLISYSAGALITIFVFIFTVDRYQHKWEARHDVKMEMVKEYEKASLTSILSSYDALKAARFYGKGRDSSADIQKWQDDVYDNLFIAENNLKYWFARKRNEPESAINNRLHQLEKLRVKIKADVDSGTGFTMRQLSASDRAEEWEKYKANTWKVLKAEYMSTDSLVLSTCRDLLIND